MYVAGEERCEVWASLCSYFNRFHNSSQFMCISRKYRRRKNKRIRITKDTQIRWKQPILLAAVFSSDFFLFIRFSFSASALTILFSHSLEVTDISKCTSISNNAELLEHTWHPSARAILIRIINIRANIRYRSASIWFIFFFLQFFQTNQIQVEWGRKRERGGGESWNMTHAFFAIDLPFCCEVLLWIEALDCWLHQWQQMQWLNNLIELCTIVVYSLRL